MLRRVISMLIPQKLIMVLRLLALKASVRRVRKSGKPLFLTGVPRHGNLGDHAIVSACLLFFRDYFPDYTVVEIPLYTYDINCLKSIIGGSPVFIPGGGSLGTLWIDAESEIRAIVSIFKVNPVVVLPQTIYYEDSKWGQKELERSKGIYASNDKLILCARENASYWFMEREYTGSNVLLAPDMAMYLQGVKGGERSGILLCMRADKESAVSGADRELICNMAKELPDDVCFTDTVINARIYSARAREKQLGRKLAQFAGARLVITDRLHGMIFSALAGTPCIALNNSSGKVRAVFEWIKPLGYIRYVENTGDIRHAAAELMNLGGCAYDKTALMPHFKALAGTVSALLEAEA